MLLLNSYAELSDEVSVRGAYHLITGGSDGAANLIEVTEESQPPKLTNLLGAFT